MMIEIERKYLVNTEMWKPAGNGVTVIQGYLSIDINRVVRVRIAGENAYLTIKGKPLGIQRAEFEYEIPKNDGDELIKMCHDFVVQKERYTQEFGGLLWEIDVFQGSNKGLVIAEVELNDAEQEIVIPPWVGKEVSMIPKYNNSKLAVKPFLSWRKV